MWHILILAILAIACGSEVPTLRYLEDPPASRGAWFRKNVGVGLVGGNFQTWTDPDSGLSFTAASAAQRPSDGGGYPRTNGVNQELGSGPTYAQAGLTATEFLIIAVVHPEWVTQWNSLGGDAGANIWSENERWLWLGMMRAQADGSPPDRFHLGIWNTGTVLSDLEKRREIIIPTQMDQDHLIWLRLKDQVLSAGVDNLSPHYTLAASGIEKMTVATLLGGDLTNTRQHAGAVKELVPFGAHSDDTFRAAIRSVSWRNNINPTEILAPEPMILYPGLGQSNEEGQGTIAYVRAADPLIESLGHDGLFHKDFGYRGEFAKLNSVDGQLNYRKWGTGGAWSQTERYGYHVPMADHFRALGETRRIGLLTAGVGSTTSAQWLEDLATEPPPANKLIGAFKARLRLALARGNVKIGAIVLNQGEADAANFALATGGWATNWTAICNAIRDEFEGYFEHPTVRFVLHRMYTQSAGLAFQQQLIATQDAFAAGRSDTLVVVMPNPPSVGNVHLETPALIRLGRATAEALWIARAA